MDRPKTLAATAAPSLTAESEAGPAPSASAGAPNEADSTAPREVSVSRTLSTWMASRRCSLVFTSYKTGQVFFVGVLPNGAVSLHQQYFTRAMGVFALPDRLWVGTHYQIWRLENILAEDRRANKHFDKLYVPRNAQTVGDVDIHEVAVDRGGRIVFVNSKYSCIATLSAKFGFQPIWKPPFISRLAAEDRCHLNGMALEDGLVRYATAVSRSDVLTGWRDRRHEGGVLIDVQNDSVLTDRLSMPHSPRIHDGQLWALDSGRGYLIRVDRSTGEAENIAFCPGFLRGLAFYGRFAIVTASLPRREEAFADLELGRTIAARDGEPWCGVFIIDTQTGDTVEWIRFSGPVTELFDVVALPDTNCPMALGPASAELHSMITYDDAYAPLSST